MRYSDIGKDVHGLIGGHTYGWRGEGAGQVADLAGHLKGRWQELWFVSKSWRKQEKFLWYVFIAWLHWQKHHGEREEIFHFFFFISGPSTGWGIPRVKRWVSRGQRRFNTLVQARHSSCEFNTCLPRALLHEHGWVVESIRAKERRKKGERSGNTPSIHPPYHSFRPCKENKSLVFFGIITLIEITNGNGLR